MWRRVESLRFEVVGLSGVSGEFRVEFPGAPVGSYLVRVSAIDTAGNRSVWLSVPVTVVADELAPVVDVVSPVSGAVVVDSVGVVASGVVSDDVGLDRVRVGLLSTEGAGWYVAPGRESRFEVVGLSGVSGEFRVEFPGAPVGSYLVRVSAIDTAGNRSVWLSVPVTVVADELAPVVDVVSPVSGAVVVDSVGVVASGVVSDDVGLDRVRVGLLSTEGAGWYVAPGRESRFEVVGLSGVSGEFRVEFPGAPVGSYLVRVSAIDTAGNRSRWVPVPVTVVSVADAPTGVSASSGGNASSTVSWSSPGNDGGAPITSYDVQREGADTRTDAASPLVWTGLSNGGSYRFRVARLQHRRLW